MRGFTLIEITIVLALLAVVAGVSIEAGAHALQGDALTHDRATLLGLLVDARSRSLGNDAEVPHGVCFDAARQAYESFAGTPHASDAMTRAGANVTVSSAGADISCAGGGIIFSPLSGEAASTTLVLAQGGRAVSIFINDEGRIDW